MAKDLRHLTITPVCGSFPDCCYKDLYAVGLSPILFQHDNVSCYKEGIIKTWFAKVNP